MTDQNLKHLELVIGKWLQALREEKGLSQEGLALQLGKGQSDIAKIEKGQKKITMIGILRWMAALSIPKKRLDEFLTGLYAEITEN